jgi:hypothetical protein
LDFIVKDLNHQLSNLQNDVEWFSLIF